MEGNIGFLSVVPIIIVIILAVWTKRTMASLVIGGLVAAIVGYGIHFFYPWTDALYVPLADGTWEWMALVCGLFGSMVGLFHKANCITSFADIAYKFANTRRKSLVATFILGCVVFVDDWLDVLITGHAMMPVTDKNNVPREKLAYIITAHCCNLCTLVPFSTWTAFYIGQYEDNGICAKGEGFATYVHSIPLFFFPIISLIICLLICLGWFPLYGPMKTAVKRAREGQVLPDGADLNAEAPAEFAAKGSSAWNFVIPIVVLAVITIITQEILYGIIIGLAVCAVMYFPQRLMNYSEFCVAMMDGFKDMIGVIGIVYAAFVLKALNLHNGMADYIIGLVEGNISPQVLPAVSFVIMSCLVFAAGNFWGMVAISFPVIAPIGLAAGANMMLIASSVVCGTAVGATACFYASEVSLTCAVTNVPNSTYAKTSIPLIAPAFVLSFICFLIAGFAM